MIIPEIISEDKVLFTTTDQATKRGMTLTLTPKMFKILSADLYKNKVRAIIRELSTNAWDSHVEAGTEDKNFDLQLPTYLDPIFRIRDYGTGISEEAVFEVYNGLFNSTKTQTNEVTGMLGLGSKTPFAYTDQVMLISYQDGVMKSYISAKEDGIPHTTKTFEGPTTEPNGLEVQFAVNTNDVYNFELEAKSVYMTFMRGAGPNFLNTDLNLDEIRGTLTKVCENVWMKPDRGYNDPKLFVIQGNVAYPVEQKYLPEAYNESIGRIENTNSTFFLEVPIGTVDFTPSREALDESKENYDRITPFIEGLDEHFMGHFRKQWDHVNTNFQAAYLFGADASHKGDFFSKHYLKRLLKEKGIDQNDSSWKSEDVTPLLKTLEIEIKARRNGTSTLYKSIGFDANGGSCDVLETRNVFQAMKNCLIVVVDQTKKYRSRVKSFFAGRPETLFILKKAHAEPKALAEFLGMFEGLAEVHYTSKLPDVSVTGRPRKKPVRYRWFQRVGESVVASNLKTLDDLGVDSTKEFYYYETESSSVGKSELNQLHSMGVVDKKSVVTFATKKEAADIVKVFPTAKPLLPAIDKYFKDNYTLEQIVKDASFSEQLTYSSTINWFGGVFDKLPEEEWSLYHGGDKYAEYLAHKSSDEYLSLVKRLNILRRVFKEESVLGGAVSFLNEAFDSLQQEFPLATGVRTSGLTSGRGDVSMMANVLKLLKKDEETVDECTDRCNGDEQQRHDDNGWPTEDYCF